MRLALILTNDWEVFGDGSGDYFEIQDRPMHALLDAVAARGACVTVMADVGYRRAVQRLAEHEAWASEIAAAWDATVRKTICRGSDVQCHLHPQWVDARHDGQRWHVNLDKWRTSSLDPDELAAVLTWGKEHLDTLLGPSDADYACAVFRAGAYAIEPSAAVIRALLEAGFQGDSSVVGGRHDPGICDYRAVPSQTLPWFAHPLDIKRTDPSGEGLLEISVSGASRWESPLLHRLWPALYYRLTFGTRLSQVDARWLRENTRLMRDRYPAARRPAVPGQTVRRIPRLGRKLIRRAPALLDYDDLPPAAFIRVIEDATREVAGQLDKDIDAVIPLVAIGHVKAMHNTHNLEAVLEALNTRYGDRLSYWTMTQAVRYWREKLGVLRELP